MRHSESDCTGEALFSRRLVDSTTDCPRVPFVTKDEQDERRFLERLRAGVIGADVEIETPYGRKPLRYFDFIASGRFHRDVEEEIAERVLPYMANTHTESSFTGRHMTRLFENAFRKIARYMHANENDVVIPVGSGSTGTINRLIHVLGMRLPDQLEEKYALSKHIPQEDRPVVFRSMMEHHSNDICWRETIAENVYVELNEQGCICPESLAEKMQPYKRRRFKIGTFSAASNVTGILNDCHALARVLHENGAWAFFDFAAAGPYVEINMHPENDPLGYFDAVFLSVHKFLGGPRTPGILVANKNLFTNRVPVEPGGGTVLYTSPWDHRYLASIAHRETGGTPPIVQSIQAGLAFDLKAAMGEARIERIEHDYMRRALTEWMQNDRILILGLTDAKRLGVFSVIFKELHHNLAAALFNDLFGIQVRGGCMCAGPYGHLLLHIEQSHSAEIRDRLDSGHIGEKPGWVRISFSPTVSEDEFQALLEAVDHISKHGKRYESQYKLVDDTGEWECEGCGQGVRG
ncbi:MAG: aminotransferase class V-fold PLP-dependent enzyme [Calditrichaeota bacterium]|nr:aminotransferase class V-fold PLP-dependent enzyme [Calditrichota bacterium]MCB9365919.1 aminotransferase class V-fold PLP-dependent enzyme [Calditrichota bacterium]